MKNFDTGTTYWDRFGDNYLQGQDTSALLILLLIMLGVILLIFVVRRLVQENFVDREGKRVFNELCGAHGLTRKERRLLLAYAQNLALKNRAAVFVRPSLFEDPGLRAEQVRGIAGKLNLNLDAAGALNDGLREKLFGEYRDNGTLRGQTDTVYQEQAQ
jgi:hypothetical protein